MLNEILTVLISNFAVVMSCMILLWILSLLIKDVTFIDSFWGLGFVVIAFFTFTRTGGADPRKMLILILTSTWGLRLALHLMLRWRKEGPDPRYVKMLSKAPGNRHLFSLRKVFLIQGVLMWIISLPIQIGQVFSDPTNLGILAYLGAGLAIIGIFFETIGDWQLLQFRKDPETVGKACDRGLWRYTRHPNYFGDCCVWWGLFLIASENPIGLISIIGPVIITYILIKWSGASLLEWKLKKTRPGYEEYMRRTSAFIPWPPKK